MNSRFSLACRVVLALLSLNLAAGVRAEDPRVVVVLKSADDLIADLKHLCVDLAGERNGWENIILPNVDLSLSGVQDKTRPSRYDQLIGGKTGHRQQFMVPIDNVNDYINRQLVPFGIVVRQDPRDRSLYALRGGIFNGWMRVKAGYAVIAGADHREDIPASMPAPGDSHAELLEQGYDAAARLDNSQTTPEQRTAAFATFRTNALGGLQKRADETPGDFALRQFNREQWLETMQRLFVESSLVTVGLTIDAEENVGTGKFVLAAAPETPLAEMLNGQAQQASRFAGMVRPERPVLAARINFVRSQRSTRQFAELCKLMKAPLQQQIDAREGLTDDQKRARREIAGLVLDMLTTSLDVGQWDGLVQITSSAGGRHAGLIAIGVRDSAPVATILKLLPASLNGCRADLNVDTAGDVTIHKLTVTEGYPQALQEFFGESGEVFVGAGPDAIWVSIGDGAVEALKAGVAAAAKPPEGDADPTVASLDLHLLEVLRLVNRLRSEGGTDEDREANTALMLEDDENYRLRIDLKRIEDRLEGDLLFESGILKAIGEAIVEYARENLG